MADSIASVLANLTKAMNAGEDLNNVLDSISKNSQEAFSKGGMTEYLRTLRKVEIQVKELNKAQSAYNKASKDMEGAKNDKERSNALDRLNRLAKVQVDAQEKVNKTLNEQNEIMANNQQHLADSTEKIRQNWEQNTKLGAVYRASTGALAQFTAGITAGTMAMKAWGKWSDAVRTKQELMIKSFRGMDSSESLGETASSVKDLEVSIRHASAAAVRFRFDTSAASDLMIKFQKIAGTENPQALGAMSEATMAAARVTGTDLGSAMQFVQDRIDKYNGSVTSAIMAMDETNEEAGRINNTFNDTRIRTDDVINSINRITSASNIFAVDQQFLSKVMMRNMNAMQEAGHSYDFAKDQALNFMEAITTKAPEFMRIKVGQTLVDEMNTALDEGGPEEFMQKFGNQLEKEKPGLAKQVQEIIEDTTKSTLTKVQMVQTLTSGLELGMSTMKDQILDLTDGVEDGVQIISSVYQVNQVEAQKLIDQANEMREVEKEQIALEKDLVKLRSASVEEAAKIISKGKTEYEINKETGEIKAKQYKIDQQALELALRTEDGLEKLVIAERQRLETKDLQTDRMLEEMSATKDLQNEKAKLKVLEEKRAEALKGLTDKGAIEQIRSVHDTMIENQKKVIDKTAKKAGKESLSIMEGFTQKASKFLENTNILDMTQAKAFFEEHAGLFQFAGMAAIFAGFQWKFKRTLDNFINDLAGVMDGSGGGGGFGGRGRKGPRRAGAFKKMGRAGSFMRKGLGRFGKGRFGRGVQAVGNIGSKLGGAGRLLGGATKLPGKMFGGAGKLLKGATKGIGKIAGPAAGLLDLGINLASGEGIGRSLFKAAGSTIGGALGATAGSVVPVAGTIAGGAAGGMAGDYIGGQIADFFGFGSPDEMESAAAQKGMSGDVVSNLQKSSGPQASIQGPGSGSGSGTLQSGGMRQVGDKIMLEIDGGGLLSIMGNLQNRAANA